MTNILSKPAALGHIPKCFFVELNRVTEEQTWQPQKAFWKADVAGGSLYLVLCSTPDTPAS